MSLIPFQHHPFLRTGDWWADLTPSHLFDQDFGMEVFNDMPRGLNRPYWTRPPRAAIDALESETGGVSEVHNDPDRFSVKLDVSHFKPEEITVKSMENGLVITGKHEEKMDQHGFVSRTFTRRYMLPKAVDPATLTSTLTNDGVLYIDAPKLALENPNERHIPIKMGTAPRAITHKKSTDKDKDKKG